MSVSVDQIIHAGWVLPMSLSPAQYAQNPASALLQAHALVIQDNCVLDLLPSTQVSQKYASQLEFNLPGHIVMPGLINAHTHAAMTLFRGFADDLPLQTWLQNHIWPAESRWVSEDFVRCGTELAIVESLCSGATCFNDMYFYPDVAAAVAQQLGFRMNLSPPVLDFPTAWAGSASEYLEKAADLMTHHPAHSGNSLVSVGLGPHAPYTLSDQSIEQVADVADAHKAWIHMHVHETHAEVLESEKQYGCRPLARLQGLGVLSERFQAVHMTQISEQDLQTIKETHLQIIHCPQSNLKLASGFCPVAKLLDAGVNIAIGTDGAASNNNLDMFAELRTAALLAKAVAEDAAAFNSYRVLYAATMGSAACFQMQDQIGSLAVGKAADLIAIDLDQWRTQPSFNPISDLIYAISAQQVTHAWVAGHLLLDDRTIRCLNGADLKTQVRHWREKIRG